MISTTRISTATTDLSCPLTVGWDTFNGSDSMIVVETVPSLPPEDFYIRDFSNSCRIFAIEIFQVFLSEEI